MSEGKDPLCQDGKNQRVSSTDLHTGPVFLIKTGNEHTVSDSETGRGWDDDLKERDEFVDLIHGVYAYLPKSPRMPRTAIEAV